MSEYTNNSAKINKQHQNTVLRIAKNSVFIAGGIVFGGTAPTYADDLAAAISGGKVSAQLRYRYELVDDESFTKDAQASTLRTRLGYATGNYHDFSAFLQFEDVTIVGNEHYNSTTNGLTQFPVVADPASTEVNQAYIGYKNWDTEFKYGRQVITYDNHRFIGDVGWRQNQQTYDALAIVTNALPQTTVSFAHVTNTNRIFSERHPTLKDVHLNGDLLNIAYKGFGGGSLVGYGYFIDYDPGQPFAVTASNKTLGLRFDGGKQLASMKLLYTAELAQQSDYKDGASIVDADYYFGMIGVEITGVQLKLNYEQLTGNGNYALQTPFATLHAFNGWADKFLTTPVDGLTDIFISVGGTVAGTNLLAIYHDYSSDNLDYDYGKEWNFSAAWKLTKELSLLAKYATYDGGKNSSNISRNPVLSRDSNKTWLQAEFQF